MAVRSIRKPSVALIALLCAGCRPGAPCAPVASPTSAADSAARVEVRRAKSRPDVAVIVRDGDPRPAVALAVLTGNADASAALAAIVESRLRKSGFAATDSRLDRDGFRIRTLVDNPERIAPLAAAMRAAIATPIAQGAPELAAAGQKIAALHRHPFEGAAVDAVSRCTGEAGVAAGTPAPDPGSKDGAAQIDAWRRSVYSIGRVAFGAAGPDGIGDRLARSVEQQEGWPEGAALTDTWPAEDVVGAFSSADRPAGTARLTVAMWVSDPDDAVSAAAGLGRPDGSLVARLSGLPAPFRLIEAGATARPAGGCLSVSLEARRPGNGGGGVEEASAIAAVVARQEMNQEIANAKLDRGSEPTAQALGKGARRAVNGAVDPREAAGLGAFWALVGRSAKTENREQPAAIALSVGLAKGDPRPEDADAAASQRFSIAYQRADRVSRIPALEHREKLERGQRDFWVLLASPCGSAAETDADAGAAALALMAAIAARKPNDGVALEPLVTPDAIGVVAHAPRARGESEASLAARVARAAARAFASVNLPPSAFAEARAALLARLGDGASPDGRAFGAAAGLVAPSHPSWIAPLGSWDAIAQNGAGGASLRWSAIAQGPLRMATIANWDIAQAEIAAREADRWLVRRGDEQRACPAVDAGRQSRSGTLQMSIAAPAPVAQAIVALPAPLPAGQDRPFAELLLAGLSGSDGWLSKAMGSMNAGASAQARLVGGSRASALVIDVRAPESALESAVAQARGVLQRIRAGALTQADLDRSLAVRRRWDVEASLDPRRRLLDLWQTSRPATAPAPALDGWRAWAAAALGEDRLIVVIAKPKR